MTESSAELSIDLLLAQWDEAQTSTPRPDGEDSWLATAGCLDALRSAYCGAPPGSDGLPFGPFRLRRELGRGGFGIVFLADDPRLGRAVAVKIPRPEFVFDVDGRTRFLHEARMAATLDHPHIVAIHETGEVGAVVYIAMAYSPGPTLAEWLKRRNAPLTPRHAAELIAKLADAVHHAHTRGILHRDLKPGNVLMQSVRDEDGQCWSPDAAPKITDFGLARRLDDPGMTQTGAVMGTPAYMAPEQAAGDSKSIGTHSDVFALGAILQELLTGQPPFGRERGGLLQRIQCAEPTPLPRTVPADLAAICQKCLEKSPSRRYESAGELAADAKRFVAGEPTVARPLGWTEAARQWMRRRPTLILGLAVVAALVVFGVGFSVWQVRQAMIERDRNGQFQSSSNQFRYALMHLESGHYRRGYDSMAPTLPQVRKLLSHDPGNKTYLRAVIDHLMLTGHFCRGLNRNDEAKKHFVDAERLMDECCRQHPRDLEAASSHNDTLIHLIGLGWWTGDYSDETLDWCRKRAALCRRVFDLDRSESAAAFALFERLQDVGDYLLIHGKYAQAQAAYDEAVRLMNTIDTRNWAPAVLNGFRERLHLIERSSHPDFGGPRECIRLTRHEDFNAGLVRILYRLQAHAEIARLADVILHRGLGVSVKYRAARAYSLAALAAPPGEDRDRYRKRCLEIIQDVGQINDEIATILCNDPELGEYVRQLSH